MILAEAAQTNPAWTASDYTAIIGAITGSAALIWNFAKLWIDRRAALRVDLFEGSHSQIDKMTELFYRVEIFNLGPPVTIRNIILDVRSKRFFNRLSKRLERIGQLPADQPALPCRIEEGKEFIGEFRLTQPAAKGFLEKGDIYVSVYHSRAKSPILIKARDKYGVHAQALKLKY